MISVVVADDEALIRESFRMLLEPEPGIEWVGEASNGREAVERARQLRPDLVLMDVRMPVMDGLEATRAIAAGGLPSHVLVLTTYDSDAYLYEAMRAGASGFCLKDVRRDELINAIRTVAAGDMLLHPTLSRRLLERFTASPPPGAPRPERLGLTDRETQVLNLVGQGLSNSEIAAALFLGESTVKTHLKNLMRKLDLRDRVQAVVFDYESGLIRPGSKPS
jgi:DNA-binding NarL/FixJ family response regulator